VIGRPPAWSLRYDTHAIAAALRGRFAIRYLPAANPQAIP